MPAENKQKITTKKKLKIFLQKKIAEPIKDHYRNISRQDFMERD